MDEIPVGELSPKPSVILSMTTNHVMIGTSGFSYRDWLGNFYPQFCPQADFLKFYSSRFKTVEIDATFYRIPKIETVKKWAKTTPDNFVFAAKFPQAVTHEGEVDSRLEVARNFIEVMKNLDSKLGPLLLQFPYSFKPDQREILMRILDALPSEGLFAVELRNRKWLEQKELFEAMNHRRVAFCLIDHPWMPRVKVKTADFLYVRFLGDRRKIENDFSYVRFERDEELRWWRELIVEYAREGINCYVYFNNHFSGHAPSTADKLSELLKTNEASRR